MRHHDDVFFLLRVQRATSYSISQSGIDRVSEAALSEHFPQRCHNLEKKKIKFLTRSIICNIVT